ncbi:MAG: hypothetical protein J3Q66DRAFT_372870 [Benniella sp.]|nr:MAG: hypothetical protein J3Q66DRAFT_372870 [Benniella sp.]
MAPDTLVAFEGRSSKNNGQRIDLDRYFEGLAKKFNNEFKTTFETLQIRNKIYKLRRRKRHRPSIITISDTADDADDDKDDDYDEHGGGNDHSDDGDVQATSSTREQNILEVPVEKTLVHSKEKGKGKALTYRTRLDDTDLLDMLKDLRQTSMLQCEAEKEQTRREELRIEERSRAQDIAQFEQLWVKEARLRVEESRMREEIRFEEAKMREEESTKREQLREQEMTKRESIRMEIEKMKEQAKIKELDIEHTNRLLLLEETRYKRALAEKENMML